MQQKLPLNWCLFMVTAGRVQMTNVSEIIMPAFV